MGARYGHLQPEERMTLGSLCQQGGNIRAIARLQGRGPGTLGRELRRNAADGRCASAPAQRKSAQRCIEARPLPKLRSDDALWWQKS
ncbi:MAG: helix-turn-helix domain-containing protein [Ottowia sp.]|uniref:helix-turn-helix domain-containing protein n=1 Tax=Ottowia sp. TaxID=1898956 RepID=UPI0039E2CB28